MPEKEQYVSVPSWRPPRYDQADFIIMKETIAYIAYIIPSLHRKGCVTQLLDVGA